MQIDERVIGRTAASQYGAWQLEALVGEPREYRIVVYEVNESGELKSEVRQYALEVVAAPVALPVTGQTIAGNQYRTLLVTLLALTVLSVMMWAEACSESKQNRQKSNQ